MIKAESAGKSRLIRMAHAGTSDIQGIRRKDGRMICLEVKLPGKEKTLTALQREYLVKMREYGALVGLVTTPEEAFLVAQGRSQWESSDDSSLRE